MSPQLHHARSVETLTAREVGLHKHLPRGHQERVRIRVETGSFTHELHRLRLTAVRGVKLIRILRRASFIRVEIGVVSVDVTTVNKATNENDRTVRECFSSRIPPLLLHGDQSRVVEPLAFSVRRRNGTRTRVQNTNRL